MTRRNPFQATRQQHFLETAEDYTELIADLIAEKGEARNKDIAESMDISHVTVLKTLRRLQRDGYVKTGSHQPISLTEKGSKLAIFSKKRHQILLEFLRKIGVPEDICALDVEGIEHHISEDTLSALQSLLKKL